MGHLKGEGHGSTVTNAIAITTVQQKLCLVLFDLFCEPPLLLTMGFPKDNAATSNCLFRSTQGWYWSNHLPFSGHGCEEGEKYIFSNLGCLPWMKSQMSMCLGFTYKISSICDLWWATEIGYISKINEPSQGIDSSSRWQSSITRTSWGDISKWIPETLINEKVQRSRIDTIKKIINTMGTNEMRRS